MVDSTCPSVFVFVFVQRKTPEKVGVGAQNAGLSDVKSNLSPCGICRQFIRELCSQNMPIYLVPADYPREPSEADSQKGIGPGGVLETTMEVLLPHSFGPEDLELPRK